MTDKIRSIIIIGVIVLILGGLAWFKYAPQSVPFVETTTQTTSTTTGTQTISLAQISSSNDAKTVTVQAPAPLTGKIARRGTMLLGPSGMYNYIYDTDGTNVALISKTLRKELMQEGMVSPDDIKNTIRGYMDDMYKQKVPGGGNIQFLVSSTALATPKISEIVGKLKGFVQFTQTTPDLEGQAAIKITIPPQYRANSFLLDVTPTASRLTWYEGSRTKTILLPGAGFYKANRAEADVVAEASRLAVQVPPANRQNGYIIWAAIDKSGSSRYVALQTSYTTDDINFNSGLAIIKAVQQVTGAQMFFDQESAYPMGVFMGVN